MLEIFETSDPAVVLQKAVDVLMDYAHGEVVMTHAQYSDAVHRVLCRHLWREATVSDVVLQNLVNFLRGQSVHHNREICRQVLHTDFEAVQRAVGGLLSGLVTPGCFLVTVAAPAHDVTRIQQNMYQRLGYTLEHIEAAGLGEWLQYHQDWPRRRETNRSGPGQARELSSSLMTQHCQPAHTASFDTVTTVYAGNTSGTSVGSMTAGMTSDEEEDDIDERGEAEVKPGSARHMSATGAEGATSRHGRRSEALALTRLSHDPDDAPWWRRWLQFIGRHPVGVTAVCVSAVCAVAAATYLYRSPASLTQQEQQQPHTHRLSADHAAAQPMQVAGSWTQAETGSGRVAQRDGAVNLRRHA